MPGMNKLIDLAGRRSAEARAAWQRLRGQCDEALRKLSLLKQYRERYRGLLDAALKQGMPAMATLAYVDFIKQIEEVMLRQESDIGSLEAACAQRWQELVDTRRELRIYGIVSERAAAEEEQKALRHRQARLDELLQRAAQLDETWNFAR
jgi:flagellar export protein FliJ